jgi:SAM-dependent methyltransferase
VLDTVGSYDQLAPEYDLSAHEATRSLEKASLKGLRTVQRLLASHGVRRALELGCGTGTATASLIDWDGLESVVASDPSAQMLASARGKVRARSAIRRPGGPSLLWIQQTAVEAIRAHGDVDLVVASLADPFFEQSTAATLGATLLVGSYAFLSVPSRRWAIAERSGRLQMPLDLTRFRLVNGEAVVARSHVFEPHELRELLANANFEVLVVNRESGPAISRRPRPEVSWILARRSALKDP